MAAAAGAAMSVVTTVSLVALGLALLVALLRAVRGPTLVDRATALDLGGYVAAGFMAVTAIATDEATLLDAAVVVVVITFLATVVLAHYVERRRSS